jgi:cell division protein FtsQ
MVRATGGLRDMMSVAIPRALAQDVRSGNLFTKRGSAVLDAPEPSRVAMGAGPAGSRRGAAVSEMPLRRDPTYAGDYDDTFNDDRESSGRVRRRGVRVRLSGGLLPRTLWGRIGAGVGLLVLTAGAIAGIFAVRSFLLHDEHFTVPGSAAIQIAGNSHMTRAQLLSVFGEDVERNVFTIPLAERRAELESLPWVAHAAVMRLLPNRVRVAILERTPVAFVREGAQIGLVDATGVLLDMPERDVDSDNAAGFTRAAGASQYSFPVLTGIAAADPLSVRAARMKIYLGFLRDLDATGEKFSQRVSEVDLSDPEDVRAIISSNAPESAATGGSSGAGDILVHFGDEDFLARYRRYQAHLTEWRAQYPRLAAVDMRYDRQAVLEMQPGTVAPPADTAAPAATGAAPATPAAPKADAGAKATASAAKKTPTKAISAAVKQPSVKMSSKNGAPSPEPQGAPE